MAAEDTPTLGPYDRTLLNIARREAQLGEEALEAVTRSFGKKAPRRGGRLTLDALLEEMGLVTSEQRARILRELGGRVGFPDIIGYDYVGLLGQGGM